jgi:hypothetical protein
MRNVLIVLMVLAVAMFATAKDSVDHPQVTRGDLDCTGAVPIACGDFYVGTTVGGASNVSAYSCVGWNESGPEIVHELDLTGELCYEVTVDLVPDGCDLDVFFLGSCEEMDCLEHGDSGLTTGCLEPGIYYIVVDGYDGAECDYTLEVTCIECACPEPCPEEQNYMAFYEDFEREECWLPAGWTILNLGSEPTGPTWYWSDVSVCNGEGTARCTYGANDDQQDEWLITPIIYLEGATAIEVSFQHDCGLWGYCTDPMQVLYSTTGIDPADFTLRLDYTCDLPDPGCGTSVLPIEGLTGDHIYVAWRYQGLWAGSWYVDNISIVSASTPVEDTTWGTIKAMYK